MELGGSVHILPYLHNMTTTNIIERISGQLPAPGVYGKRR